MLVSNPGKKESQSPFRRVRLQLIAASKITNSVHASNNELFETFSQQQELRVQQLIQHFEGHIDNLGSMIQDQTARYEQDRKALLRPSDPIVASPPRPRITGTQTYSQSPVEGVSIRVARNTDCVIGCRCVCHRSRKSGTPSILDRVLGQLFIEYTGLPAITAKCNIPTCGGSQRPQIYAEYWFPIGIFWSQIVRFQASYHANMGPSFQLKTLRRVPDSAEAVNFATNGNIEGLQSLFSRGVASPQDISDTRGYSLLRWALYAQQYETCRFLYYAGADPDYRPKAISDNSPRSKVSDIILQGGLPREVIEAISCIRSEDWIDEQTFPSLHKIVTGLSRRDLEDELLHNPENVNDVDALGRTALLWAAARGDERAVVTLLSCGADPNILDHQHAGPVSYAADRNNTVCTRILLEVGADPDPVIPGGYTIGSPLNCAARNASDPLLIKTLLDFNADVDACGVDGRTSLIHAARTDNTAFALLLLESNANINAISTAGQTPLTTAVTNNSHRILELLLRRWSDYSNCPRLRGPHLLRTVAQYADLETLAILCKTDHFRLKTDKDYSAGDFELTLRQRYDADEKLEIAFNEFMAMVRHEVSVESQMEKGIAPTLFASGIRLVDIDSDENSDEYHDAADEI